MLASFNINTMEAEESLIPKTGSLNTTMDSGGLQEPDMQTYASCPKCGANFHSDPGHDNSKQQLNGKKILHRCSHCDEYFSTLPNTDGKSGNNIGLRLCSVNSLYQCLLCNKTFVTLLERNKHMATHSGVTTYMCTICGFVSNEKSAIESHMLAHKASNVYKCPVCCSVFLSAAELDQHLTRHLGDTLHRCTQCHFVSTTKSAMQPQMMSLTLVQSEAQRHQETGVVTQDINIRITYSCFPKGDQEASLLDNNDMSDECETYPLHQSGSAESENENSPFYLDDAAAPHTANFDWESTSQHLLDPPIMETEVEGFLLHLSSKAQKVKTEGESSLPHLSINAKPKKVKTKSTVEERKSAVVDGKKEGIQDNSSSLASRPRRVKAKSSVKIQSIVKTKKSTVLDIIDPETVNDVEDLETVNDIQDPDGDSKDEEHFTSDGEVKKREASATRKKDKTKGLKAKAKRSEAKVIKQSPKEIRNCPFCARTFKTTGLNQHVACHETCALCGTRFSTQSELQEHIQGHIVGKEYKCLVCMQWSSDILTHMATHPQDFIHPQTRPKEKRDTAEEPYKCTICAMGFAKKKFLAAHLRTHNSVMSYSCFLCGKLYAVFKSLVTHIKRHTREKQCQCSHCDKQFSEDRNLNRHIMQQHTDKRPHQCSLCEERFATREHLNYHTKRHHSKAECHQCPHCPKSFKLNEGLRNHINSCHKGKDYTCGHCGKKLSSALALKEHEMRHTRERPFPCSMCSKQYVSKAQLKVHMESHIAERPRPHLCSMCGKSYCTYTDLCTHILMKHTEAQHKCSVCGKGFHRASLLKYHMRTHTGEKPFLCDECGRSFGSQELLKRHSHAPKRPGRKKRKTDSEGWPETALALPVTAGGVSETEAAVSSLNEPLIEVHGGGVPEPYSFMTIELVSDV